MIFPVIFGGTLLYLQAVIDEPKSLIINKHNLTWEFVPLQLFSLFITLNFFTFTRVGFFFLTWFFVLLSQDVISISPVCMQAFSCRMAFYHLVASGHAAAMLTVRKIFRSHTGEVWTLGVGMGQGTAILPQYCGPTVFRRIQALCYHSVSCTIFSGWRHGGMGEFLVPPAKDINNQESRSLVGYERTERADPAWMTLLLYLG